ncbi:unnamed protein product [Linum trigynum]|uniref:Folate-biopterin transporter 2 n=1 Tax=Linum trigynum TaxID=586398 RepID=A0AAV2EHG2_9ROSI
MVEDDENVEAASGGEVMEVGRDGGGRSCSRDCLLTPLYWFKMLAKETHWSFVYGVLVVYGISQGFGGAFSKVGTEYYMKDVQKVQPSESQIYQGLISIPWLVKPIWGLLTDVIPILGFRRRPYFILAGLLGVASMLLLSLGGKMHLFLAVLLLISGSAGVAIADVTVDACVAQNSNVHHSLAADMQSLCALSSSVGALIGFGFSGIFVDLLGPKGVFGLLAIPAALVLSVGVLLEEPLMPNFSYKQVSHRFVEAGKAMWITLNYPEVWRPCLYMYLSLTLSVNIDEGLFYWYTDSKGGPSFSQETVGFIFSIGSIGSLLGALLYQNVLKDHPFRNLLFWTQLLSGLAGMLDLILVLRLNLRFGMPDYFFAVIDNSVTQLIGRLKWMPLLVLSSKLCPPGIEGTFFALLMSIDNLGTLSSSWGGGVLLHIMNVTRTKFDSLWLVILLRNVLRITPLLLLFLIPAGDPNASILPSEALAEEKETGTPADGDLELVSLVGFQMIDAFAESQELPMNTVQCKALFGEGYVGDAPVLLAKPQTYMNLSGESVGPLAAYYKLPLNKVVVVYDDMDLPCGVLRLQPKGGHFSHNGLKSVIYHFRGNREFARLRIGIGRPPGQMDPKAFLLQRFNATAQGRIDAALPEGVAALKSILSKGLTETARWFNQQQKYKHIRVQTLPT